LCRPPGPAPQVRRIVPRAEQRHAQGGLAGGVKFQIRSGSMFGTVYRFTAGAVEPLTSIAWSWLRRE
jgi:hypothetical protein